MKRDSRSPVAFFMIGIAVFFLAGFFLLVTFGAQTYRDAVAGQTQNNQTRALLGYLTTCARMNDRPGAVSFLEKSNGSREVSSHMLVIEDRDSGYSIRIYLYNGVLVEDYGQTGSELNPKSAMPIGETVRFRVEELAADTYAVTTDAGVVIFNMRSGDDPAE